MTDYTLIHIATPIIVILVILALAVLTDYILDPWKKPVPPPKAEHLVNWCGRNGHVVIRAQEWRCAHCDERWPITPMTVELGHQGQPGRAA